MVCRALAFAGQALLAVDEILMLVHASCVALGEKGVLLTGPPGAGKSDLALRLIDRGAVLVSDDQTEIELSGGELVARAPASIRGLLEIRSVGLFRFPVRDLIPLCLQVDLVSSEETLTRLPIEDAIKILDRPLRRLRLRATEASTDAKIRALLTQTSLAGTP